MKFSSRKDVLFTLVILTVCSLLLGIVIFDFFKENASIKGIFPLVTIVCVVSFLLWLFFDTKYELTETALKYKSGPIQGEIAIASIKEIIKNKTLWVGLKPATAAKGLIVKYNKYDEIYISPRSNDTFIRKIVEINENIKIR
ncbi:PH domain-containing protein [Mariniflexile sp.]|uniref:PH domain-containing protein n=1 Tax=Mariniflexile sp. TaxID=1979402 RepID=UPI003566CB76